MPEPISIAAIDAGSNAIRMVIARAESSDDIQVLETERWPVRLGHRAFTEGRLDRATLDRAVQAFRHFRSRMRRYGVRDCRAVATAAAREARNRHALVHRVFHESGIRLEVVDSAEEARLVRAAVLGQLGEKLAPRLIIDLGGGSLEISLLRGKAVIQTVALPLGSVRLMETFGISGQVNEEQLERLRHHLLSMLKTAWPDQPDFSRSIAVACGGNAEALARIAAGPRVKGISVLNLRLLHDRLWQMLSLDIPQRMRVFGVRRDRAEVMGIAAIVFTTLGRWLRMRELLVPGVGVREGILRDLVLEHFGVPRGWAPDGPEQAVLEQARQFAAKLHSNLAHVEHVRYLAASLFDQLAPVHHLPGNLRLPLELAAVLHDVGMVVSADGHHKHGEYMVRYAEIPGLGGLDQLLTACLVRYHVKSVPEPHHKLYSSLSSRQRRQVRALAGILRIAAGLDSKENQAVIGVEVQPEKRDIWFRIAGNSGCEGALRAARRSVDIFEDEFGLRAHFGRAEMDAAIHAGADGLRAAQSHRSSRRKSRNGERWRSSAA